LSKRLIVNADDFGAAVEVNEAIERAHRDGILRSASLMVAAPAANDAVERARRLPGLAVGLHLVLVHGRPVLPPERVPDLVDERGFFPTDLVKAGVCYFFLPRVRKQLEDEIRAQFRIFAKTGLSLDHVNAQCHMHVHPTIFGLLLRVGREFDMRAVRVPLEAIIPATRACGDKLPTRVGYALVANWCIARMRYLARRNGVTCNYLAFGVNDAGTMNEARVLRIIEAMPDGNSEMFFHPATGPFEGADRGTERYDWRGELDALLSERVRRALVRHNVSLTTYGELAAAS
jgi:hopanoid biosynthesis associated protein HpnK